MNASCTIASILEFIFKDQKWIRDTYLLAFICIFKVRLDHQQPDIMMINCGQDAILDLLEAHQMSIPMNCDN